MSRRAGFTLLETVVSLVIFSSIGAALLVATLAGQSTQQSVASESHLNRSMRTAARSLTEELRSSSDSQILVTQLADGNDSVRFMVPVQVGATLGWGVHDRTLGPDEASQNRVGWSLRYTVESVLSQGVTTRRLVRQVLDAAQNVVGQRLVAERVRSGSAVPPGFTVRKPGATWEITLSTDARNPQEQGIREVFHVQARNQ